MKSSKHLSKEMKCYKMRAVTPTIRQGKSCVCVCPCVYVCICLLQSACVCGTLTVPLVPLHFPAVTMTWQRTEGSARLTSVGLKEVKKEVVLEVEENFSLICFLPHNITHFIVSCNIISHIKIM